MTPRRVWEDGGDGGEEGEPVDVGGLGLDEAATPAEALGGRRIGIFL